MISVLSISKRRRKDFEDLQFLSFFNKIEFLVRSETETNW